MNQLSYIPITCQRTKPPPSTADADFIGIDELSTHRWLCKGQGRNTMVPASEWICSHLALACGLPVPPFAVVELQSQPGVPYFGSQWQGGALEFLNAHGRISNSQIFEQTHAVDLFVHNTDRHCGNYLYLELAGEIVARVIDFSRAWTVMGWPLPPLPMPACNTTTELPALLSQNPKPYQPPTTILDRIVTMADDWMESTMTDMPTVWLDTAHRVELDQWWRSDARKTRANDAKLALP
jgi:hypothetical protein